MGKDNPVWNELSIESEKVYRFSIAILLPVFCLYFLPYFIFWSDTFFKEIKSIIVVLRFSGAILIISWVITRIFIYLLFLIIGIIAHELLHAIGWMIMTGKGFRNISFGIIWELMAPYAHIKIPISILAYRIGIILPLILVGIFPGVYGLVTGNVEWVFFGFIFTVAAAGDIIMLWLIRKIPSRRLVKDHPEKLGCFIYQ
ncbi:MAG: DUF3267 domain-containing protein [Bacteroidales bacterium]|nr:DUF3267 domain-containing protein [Bacteroidales bacterium]